MAKLLKVIIPVVLFLLSTCSLVVHKGSCVHLFKLLKTPDFNPQARLLVLTCTLLLPLLLSIIHMLWNVPILTRSNYPVVPSARKLFGDLLACTLETICLGGVANVLLTTSLSVEDVLMMSSPVLSIQLLKVFVSDLKTITLFTQVAKLMTRSAKVPVRLSLILLCVLVPLIYATHLHVGDVIGFRDTLIQMISMFVLSFTWTKSLGIDSSDTNVTNITRRTHYLYITFKIIATLFFMSVISTQHYHHFEFGSEIDNLNNLPVHARYDLLFVLLILTTSAIFFKYVAFLSAMMCQFLYGVYLPSAVSTIVIAVVTFCSGLEINDNILIPYKTGSFFIQSLMIACVTTVYVLGWRVFSRSPQVLMASYDQIFSGYGWNFLLLDIETILSVYTRIKTAKLDKVVRQDARSNIFVCVTMFRETKLEMSTLITSLRKLAESRSFSMPSLSFNFHVFFDDGCRKDNLMHHAFQFLEILNSHKMKTHHMCRTVYGIQYQSAFPNNLSPITVHFKDSSKFKHRKRWSQAMYIQYILNFCLKTFEKHKSRAPSTSKTSSSKVNAAFTAPDILMNKHMDIVLERSLSERDTVKTFDLILETGLHNKNERSDNSGTFHSSNLNYAQMDRSKLFEMASKLLSSSDVNMNLGQEHSSSHAFGQPERFSDLNIMSNIGLDDVDEENTYILALDGDIQFEPSSVWELYLGCLSDETVGGVCGRTHPRAATSSGPAIWFQKLDYSFDFWATKSTQNVLGSVTCCPGCFSLFRAKALKDVVDTICEPTRTSADLYLKDIGEDRWITSLMIFKGWNMKYIFNAHNDTYCPASFPELMRQRKRWILSDFANELLLLSKGWWLVRSNRFISGVFIAYTFLLFASKLQLVSSMIFMMAVSTNLMLDLNFLGCIIILAALFIIYIVCCLKTGGKTLVRIVMAYGAIFGVACAVNFVYILYYVTERFTSSDQDLSKFFFLILILSSGVLLYAACLHPWDLHYLIYLPVYLLYTPAVSMFLPVYSICGIGDQRWGTRDGAADEDDVVSCSLSSRMSCCKKDTFNENDKEIEAEDVALEKCDVTVAATPPVQDMESIPGLVVEAEFWKHIGQTILGTDVNKGTDSQELTEKLLDLRKVCLALYLLVNGVILVSTTAMYILLQTSSQEVARYYFIVFGVMTLVKTSIPVAGMTIHHMYTAVRITALNVFGGDFPTWMPSSTTTAA